MTAQPFWDRVAPKYSRKPIDDPAAYEKKLAQVSALLQATDHVLEIGCGTGSTALRLAPCVAHYTATDGSRSMIDIARSKLELDTPTNVTFQQADAVEMVEGRPFDAVCAFSLLHLVEDVPKVIAIVRKQLKPGGMFISKSVCLKDVPFPIRAMVNALAFVGIAPRVTFLGEAELVQHLQDADFEIEQNVHFGKKRMSPFIVARRSNA
ncbi:Methylase involved in ubiquinone/menaquinone biosynthesis [Hoeflea phototrophica DFL-43]|jgi:ubiquinone/menaquinone biosynthesis C-methylase UbiE|uniref:Methylase involved in ubiquinone/menaquinone biosynthesis n=1 Tax=Hoeflea phototrophica (strain DSM 17068 / NCIMB 14078 / DFL-43) TaxID=411684 RepID=A9CYV4_HOEPD|nr:class I SAM-dependent methyltransferase [Hoeflea phototrophica]EDQ34648.1 Methylase involved in ubiquinone/menaquinone biosynthesis [Hoeflea phototrophica DFL-43]